MIYESVHVVFDGTSAFIESESDYREFHEEDEDILIDSTWMDVDSAQKRVDILNAEIYGG